MRASAAASLAPFQLRAWRSSRVALLEVNGFFAAQARNHRFTPRAERRVRTLKREL
jgi:hypothetical protein